MSSTIDDSDASQILTISLQPLDSSYLSYSFFFWK